MSESLSNFVTTLRGGESASAATHRERVRAAARLITLLENAPSRVEELSRLVGAETLRPQRVLGVTGPAGSGKSTLVDALITEFRRQRPSWRIGVLAVDPSSPFTGGAVLGDRVRMMRHAGDEAVFIRSLSTRGQLGGVSVGVPGALAALTLFGCDLVMIETVGVGQCEIDVARLADRVCIVLAPGQGDGVQWLKAGLMEIGDLFVVNKADRDGAEVLAGQLSSALERAATVRRGKPTARQPALLLAAAAEGRGVDRITDWCLAEWS